MRLSTTETPGTRKREREIVTVGRKNNETKQTKTKTKNNPFHSIFYGRRKSRIREWTGNIYQGINRNFPFHFSFFLACIQFVFLCCFFFFCFWNWSRNNNKCKRRSFYVKWMQCNVSELNQFTTTMCLLFGSLSKWEQHGKSEFAWCRRSRFYNVPEMFVNTDTTNRFHTKCYCFLCATGDYLSSFS